MLLFDCKNCPNMGRFTSTSVHVHCSRNCYSSLLLNQFEHLPKILNEAKCLNCIVLFELPCESPMAQSCLIEDSPYPILEAQQQTIQRMAPSTQGIQPPWSEPEIFLKATFTIYFSHHHQNLLFSPFSSLLDKLRAYSRHILQQQKSRYDCLDACQYKLVTPFLQQG